MTASSIPSREAVKLPEWPVAGSLCLFALIVSASFNMTDSALQPIGKLSVCALGILMILLALICHVVKLRPLLRQTCVFFAFCLVMNLPLYPDAVYGGQGATRFIQFFMVAGMYLATASWRWPHPTLLALSVFASCYIVLFALSWVAAGLPQGYSWYFTNPNECGAFLGYLLFFVKAGESKQSPFLLRVLLGTAMIIGFLGVLASGSRATLLGVLAAISVYYCWPMITTKSRRFRLLPIALFVCVGVIVWAQVFFITDLEELGYADMVRENSGKNLNSGRATIWSMLMDLIRERPVLGFGAGVDLYEELGLAVSAHSLYFQTTVQTGFVGLFALLGMIYSVWCSFWYGRHHVMARIAGALLAGIVIHQAFEVCLTQNNLAIGMLGWLGLGIGASSSIEATLSVPQRFRV